MIVVVVPRRPVRPAWWNARIVAHECRRFDLAVLRVVTDRPLPFEPGQSVAVEVPARPRMWRYYSMANALRPDNTLDFHVRLVDGGPVSPVLVRSIRAGDWLRLGPPVGTMTFDERSGRDVLLVGGSTGLAPLKSRSGSIRRTLCPRVRRCPDRADRARPLRHWDTLWNT